MQNNIVADIPVPCPCCKGAGTYYDQDNRGRVYTNQCTACHGSCVMYLTKQQYARRIGDTDGYSTSRVYTTEEIKIITKSKDASSAFHQLVEAGYTDRKYYQVKKYRERLATRRRRRMKRESDTGN